MLSVEHCTPGGGAGHVIATPVLVNPPLGVRVIVDVPLPPAAKGEGETAAPPIINEGLPPVMVKVGGAGLVSGPPPGCGVNRSMGTTAPLVKSVFVSFTVTDVGEQAVIFVRGD